jgi:hypothetical protein
VKLRFSRKEVERGFSKSNVVRNAKFNQKQEGNTLMNSKTMIASAAVVFTFSLMLMAAQTQMQDNSANKQASAAPKTLTALVSDSMCGAHHMAKEKSPAECTRMCVKQGQKYALIVGENVYTLEGHEEELDQLAGKKATVKGNVTGETVAVQSVLPAKG